MSYDLQIEKNLNMKVHVVKLKFLLDYKASIERKRKKIQFKVDI